MRTSYAIILHGGAVSDTFAAVAIGIGLLILLGVVGGLIGVVMAQTRAIRALWALVLVAAGGLILRLCR